MMPSSKGQNLLPLDRKSKKPLMEKKRRARINRCLSDLKNLLLECLKRDPAHTSKLEKADILEMTVHLLRDLQRQQLAMAASIDSTVMDRFQHGFAECFMQVKHYTESVDGFDAGTRDRMLKHLDCRYRNIHGRTNNNNNVHSINHNHNHMHAIPAASHPPMQVPLPVVPVPNIFPLFSAFPTMCPSQQHMQMTAHMQQQQSPSSEHASDQEEQNDDDCGLYDASSLPTSPAAAPPAPQTCAVWRPWCTRS